MGKNKKKKRVRASQARQELADIINRAAYGDERVIMHRHGKDVAAVVSVDDLRVLEDCEDEARRPAKAARKS